MLAHARFSRRLVQQVAQRRTVQSAASCPKGHRYSATTLILAGAVGATIGSGILIGAGYAWYITSAFKRIADTVQPALAYLKDTRSEIGKKAPSHVLSHLRQACKAYLAYVPFSAFVVDRGFDALDEVVDAHADEANAIIEEAATEVMEVIQRDGNTRKTSSAVDIVSIMRKLLKKLAALSAKAGQPISDKLELERRGSELKASAVHASQVVSESVGKAGKEYLPKAGAVVDSVAGKVKNRIWGKHEDEKDDEK